MIVTVKRAPNLPDHNVLTTVPANGDAADTRQPWQHYFRVALEHHAGDDGLAHRAGQLSPEPRRLARHRLGDHHPDTGLFATISWRGCSPGRSHTFPYRCATRACGDRRHTSRARKQELQEHELRRRFVAAQEFAHAVKCFQDVLGRIRVRQPNVALAENAEVGPADDGHAGVLQER